MRAKYPFPSITGAITTQILVFTHETFYVEGIILLVFLLTTWTTFTMCAAKERRTRIPSVLMRFKSQCYFGTSGGAFLTALTGFRRIMMPPPFFLWAWRPLFPTMSGSRSPCSSHGCPCQHVRHLKLVLYCMTEYSYEWYIEVLNFYYVCLINLPRQLQPP